MQVINIPSCPRQSPLSSFFHGFVIQPSVAPHPSPAFLAPAWSFQPHSFRFGGHFVDVSLRRQSFFWLRWDLSRTFWLKSSSSTSPTTTVLPMFFQFPLHFRLHLMHLHGGFIILSLHG